MNILIKSAKIFDKSNKDIHLKTKDILVLNGVISKIADTITPEKNTSVISKKNLCISIGWLDTSVSFGEPGFEERETIANGLKTAAKGGFTDIILNTNTNPIPYTSSTIAFIKNKASQETTSLHPLGALTVNSETVDLAELYDMKNAGAVGFSDYKKATSNSNLLKIALQYAQNFNGLIYSFPLDTKIAGKGIVNEGDVSTSLGLKGIPALAEELQVARDLFILEYTGGKLHIPTISTAGSVKLISDAKKKGLDVSCSVALYNLLYTDSKLTEFDTTYKVLPPLRTKKDKTALINAVKNGTIDFVTTDHTPLDIEQKKIEFDNAAYGTIGLESSFGLLNTIFDTETTVEILTKGRERYGLQKPEIKEGKTACFTLFDEDTQHFISKNTSISTAKNCMFFEEKLKGQVFGILNKDRVKIL
ncbi:dihydroorotase [Cellulophaga lytica]|uniref:Amidohydrolase n=1 Tax=Cellulophaga lytica (strain ATCC 23178 / DSM 7489 / JCM 8516 / NBRC 14961 / NCIMB 1423 / VKM B-1433 / Cy l20) TaxID=867900 RepID=F0RAY1_CELLC|nr:dihydroorotase [Cellulophaga lytica]ADY30558.1 amidohydrolase [Cellulophaga lytica DSM 7489]AIM61546.1 dihydroorotase [Cellulophaga lytica]WQG78514.1 dihydroorotase [Cellulophaga lytica]